MKPAKTILFDLDGTLIDHFETFYKTYQYACSTLGPDKEISMAGFDQVKAAIGGSVPQTLRTLVGDLATPELCKCFEDYYKKNLLIGLSILEGAQELLNKLHTLGHQLAVFTNKQEVFAKPICKHLGLDTYLSEIIGTTPTSPRKPELAFTEQGLQRLCAQPETTILIGDSPFDLKSAQVCSIPAYLVATGTHSFDELENHEPKAHGVYKNMSELAKDVFQINLSN